MELIIWARKPIESGTIPTPELAALLDAHDWPSDYLHNRKETVGTDKKSRAKVIKLCKQYGVRPYLKDKQAALTVDNQTSLREGLECRVVVTHAGGEAVAATSKYKARLPQNEWTNVVKWGTGAVNCGACMVPFESETDMLHEARPNCAGNTYKTNTYGSGYCTMTPNVAGRFPANVLCTGDKPLGEGTRFFDVELWAEQHGLAEEGWAEAAEAGLIQVPKASRREKNQGCEGLPDRGRVCTANQTLTRKQCSICGCTSCGGDHTGHLPGQMTCGHSKSAIIRVPYDDNSYHAKHRVRNNHPTTKPVRLFAYLISLLCPEGGTVLDCFAGSGSTGVAAIQCGRSFVGVEMEADYVTIANARCKWAEENMPEAQEPEQLTLEAAP